MNRQRSGQAQAFSAVVLCLLLTGCGSWFKKTAVTKPTARAPESFGAPQTANAAGDAVDRAWWTLFQDPVLNGLQTQLETIHLNFRHSNSHYYIQMFHYNHSHERNHILLILY